MALDLGNLIKTAGDIYLQKRQQDLTRKQQEAIAAFAQSGGGMVQPVFNPLDSITDFFTEGPINPMAGKSITKADAERALGTRISCKRRRKRLATVSDIRDLAALKNILGNGDAFKTWIATHSR